LVSSLIEILEPSLLLAFILRQSSDCRTPSPPVFVIIWRALCSISFFLGMIESSDPTLIKCASEHKNTYAHLIPVKTLGMTRRFRKKVTSGHQGCLSLNLKRYPSLWFAEKALDKNKHRHFLFLDLNRQKTLITPYER